MRNPPFKSVPVPVAVERFYLDLATHMKLLCDTKYPQVRNVEIIAALGQMAGACIAMCFPDERDLARAMLIENVDKRCAELVQLMQSQAEAVRGPVGRA